MSGTSGGLFQGFKIPGNTQVKGTKRWRVPFEFNVIAYFDYSAGPPPTSEFDFDYGTVHFEGWGLVADVAAYGTSAGGVQLDFTLGGGGFRPGTPMPVSLNWTVKQYYPSTWNFKATLTGYLEITVPYVMIKNVTNVSDSNRTLPEDQLAYTERLDTSGIWSAEFKVDASTTEANNINSPLTGVDLGWLNQAAPGDYHAVDGSFGNRFIHQLQATSEDNDEIICQITADPNDKRYGATFFDSRAQDKVPFDFTCSNGGSAPAVVGDSLGTLKMDDNDPSATATTHTVLATVDAPTTVDFNGLITAGFNSALGQDVQIDTSWAGTLTANAGIYRSTQTFQYRNITLDGTPLSTATSAAMPAFYVSLNAIWAVANSVPSNDRYMRVLDDVNWAVTTFTHAASYTVDSFGAVAGWSGAGATVSAASGLRIVATSAGATVQKTTYALDFRNYRYLRVRAQANVAGSEGRALTLTLADLSDPLHPVSKQYGFTLAGDTAAHDFDIDLCIPNSVATGADTTDTSWAAPGSEYGMQAVTKVEIDGFAASDDITIVSLKLVLGGRVAQQFPAWILAPMNPPQTAPVPPPPAGDLLDVYQLGKDGNYYARLMTDLADGKQAVDLPHAIRPAGSSSTVTGVAANERLSITDFINVVNGSGTVSVGGSTYTPVAQPGVAAAAATNATSPVLNPSTGAPTGATYYSGALYAAYLTFDSPKAWAVDAVDSTSAPLNAWPEYSQVTLVPGMLDPQSDQNPTIRFVKRLNGSVHGLVLNNAGGVEGAAVVLAGGSSPNETAVTDANGYYMATPRLPGDSQTATQPDLSVVATIDVVNRKWTQVSFRAPLASRTCTSLMDLAAVYFPFSPQSGDMQRLGIEEWRRTGRLTEG